MNEPNQHTPQSGGSDRHRRALAALIPLLGGGLLFLGLREPALGLGVTGGLLAMVAAILSTQGLKPSGPTERITWSPSARSNKVTYFDELVRINVENLDRYYRLVEAQTGRSFTTAVATGLIGFALLATGLALGFNEQPNAAPLSYISSGAGIATEFLAAVFFYLYRQTVKQLKEYHDALLGVQSVLLAFKAVEDLKDEEQKVEMLAKVIDHLMVQRATIEAAIEAS